MCLTSCKSIETKTESDTSLYTNFTTKVESEKNIAYLDVALDGENISYSILNNQGTVETGTVYQLEENYLEKFINIANYINKDMEYNLLVFVNYKQVTFKVEDKEYDVFNAFIQKNKSLQIPVKIDGLSPGFNDILFLIVPEANQVPTTYSDEFYGEILSLRCNAFWGAEDILDRHDSLKLETINETNNNVSILEKNGIEYFDFISCDLPLKTKKQFFLCIKNKNDYYEDFILILLDNWNQIPLGEKDFELVTVESNKSGIYPVSIPFDTKGNHKLVAIAVKNPYKKYDFLSTNIESSQWVNVNVLE